MKNNLNFLLIVTMLSGVAQASQLPPKNPLINNFVGDSSSTSASASVSAGEAKQAATMTVATGPSAQEVLECPEFLETAEGKDARVCYEAAFAGDPEAQYNLGVRCEFGRGVERNNWLAYTWYLKASLNNNLSARLAVAACYRYGLGVGKDVVYAIKLYKTVDSAFQVLYQGKRLIPACSALGELYGECARNEKMARKVWLYDKLSNEYYIIAAEGGWYEAQRYFGLLYLAKGKMNKARYWLQLAARQGDRRAIAALSQLEVNEKSQEATVHQAEEVVEPVVQATDGDTASNSTQKADGKESVKE
jgi:TPR repeat protein